MPLDRFCNTVYWWVASRLDEKKRRSWDMELARPGPGDLPPEWTDEGQASAFMSFTREFEGSDDEEGG